MSAIGCMLAGAAIRQTITVNIGSMTADYNLSPSTTGVAAFYRAGFSDIIVNIFQPVYASTPSNAAFTIASSFATGDTIIVNNYSNILGHGGAGTVFGVGGAGSAGFSANFNAILTNNGIIAGGGGGGGGGSEGSGGGGAGGGNGGGVTNGAANPNISIGGPGFQYGASSFSGGGGGWVVGSTGSAPGVSVTRSTAGASAGVGGYGGGGGGSGAAYVNCLLSTSTTAISGDGSGFPTVAGSNASYAGGALTSAGGGGGGWGAAGGAAYERLSGGLSRTNAGGAGGAAINKNGKTVSVFGSGTTYGAINA